MSRRTSPRRYDSSSYVRPDYAARREAVRRQVRRRRLTAAAVTVLLLVAGGMAAWIFIGDGLAGNAKEGGSGSPGGGDSPGGTKGGGAVDSSPSISPTAGTSTSPGASPSPSPSSASPRPPGSQAATFTGTYVPILMYHRIEETSETGTNSKFFTSPHKFKQQMRALKLNGYTAVTLQQVWDYWHHKGTLPAKPIVLSFDDGTSGIVENAGPVLKKYGWPGVLSVVVGYISDSGGSLSLTPQQIRRVLADGWELDSHTIGHPSLNRMSAARVQYEVAESRRRLQERFDVPCNFFCYPGGEHSPSVEAAVEAAGYLGATTVARGCADPATPYALDRIEVDGRNVIKTFLRDLAYWEQHP